MRFILTILLLTGMMPLQAMTLTLDETEVEVTVIPAQGQPVARLLWLPSEYGVLPQEKQLAEVLARQGVESWLPDLFEAWFLPVAPSSLPQIPADALGTLILQARSEGLPLYVVGTDRGALLAVRGWQAAQQQGPLRHSALLLINPNLYVATPRPGQSARYWPETERLNAPVYLFQAELSPWRWRLKTLVEKLAKGGSDVFVHLLKQVRDRFYFRPDALPVEKKAAERFPQQIQRAMVRLTPWMTRPRALPAVQVDNPTENKAETAAPKTETQGGQRATLLPYEGPPLPPLTLHQLDGTSLDMRALCGKVVLVNFWASWCPPCVHEMPSMTALKKALAQSDFEILAINLAETRAAIEAFLQAHPVNFPVLMDSEGQAIRQWRIFAYPSSYLLDRQGRIRYAAFGALDWNSPEVQQQIRQLLSAPAHAVPHTGFCSASTGQ